MCRVFAYLSVNPILLDDVLRRPENAITKQIDGEWLDVPFYNVDGYGFTWYSETRAHFNPLSHDDTDILKKGVKLGPAGILDTKSRINDGPLLTFVKGPHPAMYKTIAAQPLNDPCFVSFCANVSSRTIFGHMRAATVPPVVTSNCHPFVFGRHSFMYNGGIANFDEVRKDILEHVSPGFVAMIEGSCDTEHLGALYMTYLCPEGKKDFRGADEHYSAREMHIALRSAIQKVQEIQAHHGISKPDNYYNTCATDGESMIGLCYRTAGNPVPLYLSVGAADSMNRKACYLKHGTVDHPEDDQDHGPAHTRRTAPTVIKWGPNDEVIGINPDILKKMIDEEESPDEHGPHVIVASEPTTKEPGWYKLWNHEIVMVDIVRKGNFKTISLDADFI